LSLRLQLLAFVALTLFLPWAGLRLVTAMEEALRLSLEQELRRGATGVAQLVAASETFEGSIRPPPGLSTALYLHPLVRPPRLNGSMVDWQFSRAAADEPDASLALQLADGVRVWLGVPDSQFLYLYIEVDDDSVVQQSVPGLAPHGDRVVLVFGEDTGNPETALLATAGGLVNSDGFVPLRGQLSPGGDQFVSTGEFEDLISGAWRSTATGYAIEARATLSLIDGALGIGVIDSDVGNATARLAAATWNESGASNALIRELPELAGILRPYQRGSERYRVLDADGWVLADSGPLDFAPVEEPEAGPTLMEQFFRRILRREDPEYAEALLSTPGRIGNPVLLRALEGEDGSAWFRRGTDVSAIVAASVPVDPNSPGRGAILIEQGSDPIQSLTNREMLRLITTTALVSPLAAAALLAYASLLSFRIRRLARGVESALGPRGEISIKLPGSKASDEIGDLSRSFQDLLGRLRDYTDYLQSLKSKLSHELRTPLAIVATSADNLEHETSTAAGQAYLARLRQGAIRLESILQAMTAATRVEQAINQTELERFDLAAVVGSCLSAYPDVYPEQAFSRQLPAEPVLIDGSAELLAQLLDKLIDNAVGFAAEGTAIDIRLLAEQTQASLEVVNRGPLLPEAMRHQLFDSLVSVRESSGDKPHLGLGLYIVTLIAEFHRAQVRAENLADGSGVRFSVVLPRSDSGSA